jgi:hypothetical protein
MNLGPDDQVVGAWAEAPTGPGWSNRVVLVCIRNGLDGSHRVDALQPEEQTPEIAVLFRTACAVSEDLIAWVRGAAEVQRGKEERRGRR